MLAEWLRQGLASGRITASYPRERGKLEQMHQGWLRLPAAAKKCGGCRACLEVCPTQALHLKEAGDSFQPEILSERCLACGLCLKVCPEGALSAGSLDKAETLHKGMSQQQPGDAPSPALKKVFRRSLHIRHIDTGSCNACETEILSLSNPYYNLHRLGFFFTASPRHADVLLITGALTLPMRDILLETYAAMPKPRFVIACGACALSGGAFAASSRRAGSTPDLLPVDVKVPGCPPNPYALLNALTLAAGHLERKGAKSDD